MAGVRRLGGILYSAPPCEDSAYWRRTFNYPKHSTPPSTSTWKISFQSHSAALKGTEDMLEVSFKVAGRTYDELAMITPEEDLKQSKPAQQRLSASAWRPPTRLKKQGDILPKHHIRRRRGRMKTRSYDIITLEGDSTKWNSIYPLERHPTRLKKQEDILPKYCIKRRGGRMTWSFLFHVIHKI